MRMTLKWGQVFCVFISMLLASCGLFPRENSLPPPIIPRETIALRTMIVERQDLIDYALFNGVVTPIRQERIHLNALSAVLLEYNPHLTRVRAGDTLAVFSNANIQARVLSLRRTLELVNIDYEVAVRIWETADADYQELLGRADRERQNQNTVLQFEQNLRAAKLNVDNSYAVVRRERINQTIAEENFRVLQDQYESFVLRAPFNGIITFSADLHIGDTFTENQLLFIISDDSSLYITVELTDAQINDNPLTPGTAVRFETFPGGAPTLERRGMIRFDGNVIPFTASQRRAAQLNQNTAVIAVHEWPRNIGLGHPPIAVQVLRSSSYNVVVIPFTALYSTGSYNYVRVFEDGASRERPVELGHRTRNEVEITRGLEPGEVIVLR
jgi:multidrug efflux pump subunit AcrA (membrane-fusion protein)